MSFLQKRVATGRNAPGSGFVFLTALPYKFRSLLLSLQVMTTSIHLLLTLFLTVLVIYGGSGVNAYFYCCDNCRSEGMEVITDHRCCEIHASALKVSLDSQRHDTANHLCEVGAHDSCGVERIAFSWETFTRNQELQPQAIDLHDVPFLAHSTQNHDLTPGAMISRPETESQKPPNLSSEVYRSLLITLLI